MKKIDFEEKIYFVKTPSAKDQTDAQVYSSKIFNTVRKSDAILRPQLNDYLKAQGLWTDEKQARLLDLMNKVEDTVNELAKGKMGKFKKLSDARKAAVDIRIWRNEYTGLLLESRELDQYTVEGQTESAKFNYLCSVCILDVNQKRLFETVEAYLEHANEPPIKMCSDELAYIANPELDRDWFANLPENKFLKKYNFVNGDLELVDKDGNLVDRDMKPINSTKTEESPFEEFDNDIG